MVPQRPVKPGGSETDRQTDRRQACDDPRPQAEAPSDHYFMVLLFCVCLWSKMHNVCVYKRSLGLFTTDDVRTSVQLIIRIPWELLLTSIKALGTWYSNLSSVCPFVNLQTEKGKRKKL